MIQALIGGIAGKIIGKVMDIIDKKVEDKNLKEQLKSEIQKLTIQQDIEEISLQAKVLLGEIHGNKLQRSWRPLLMYLILLILFNNYILFPYLSLFTDKVKVLDFPTLFWYFLIVGIGGYIPSRTYEKRILINKLLEGINNLNKNNGENKWQKK